MGAKRVEAREEAGCLLGRLRQKQEMSHEDFKHNIYEPPQKKEDREAKVIYDEREFGSIDWRMCM